jgi:hypothetical protein
MSKICFKKPEVKKSNSSHNLTILDRGIYDFALKSELAGSKVYYYEKSIKLDSKTAKIAKSKTQNVPTMVPILKIGFLKQKMTLKIRADLKSKTHETIPSVASFMDP